MLTEADIPWHGDSVSGQPLGIAVATESETVAALFESAAAVAKSTPETVDWMVFGYVAIGVILEVAGKLKASGKTTWIAAMVRAILTGTRFMGVETRYTPVVWLTEERKQTFAETLKRNRLDDREDLKVLHWHKAKGLSWPAVMAGATQYALDIGARIIVVDTISQWAGLKGDAENSNGAQLEAVAPLQEAAARGLAPVVARHERKGGGEVGESGRGGSAFSGAVDIVLSLRRGEGKTKPTVRVLHALSRFSETPDSLVIDLTDDGYIALGDEGSVATLAAETALLDRMPMSAVDALDLETLRLMEPSIAKTAAKAAIKRLFDSNKAQRCGSGKRGDPHRYFSTMNFVVATQTTRADQQPETESLINGSAFRFDGDPLGVRQ